MSKGNENDQCSYITWSLFFYHTPDASRQRKVTRAERPVGQIGKNSTPGGRVGRETSGLMSREEVEDRHLGLQSAWGRGAVIFFFFFFLLKNNCFTQFCCVLSSLSVNQP